VTRPKLFAPYLAEQLEIIAEDYAVEVEVRASRQEIPFPYVLDGAAGAELAGVEPMVLARHFPATELALIGDELADGIEVAGPDAKVPLSLFDGLRTDFSLARLAHYTGTSPEHFQRFVLFTNYHRYVDEFVDWAAEQLGRDGNTALAGAGGLMLTEPRSNARLQLSDTAWRRHQMPAYHLIGPNRSGITLVNIGVGPSNAKTITDHLAVLRPEAWLMIGHCGGLRPSQKIGDYVLAHAYLRDDHVLDPVLPPEIPLPAIAEVQQALYGAAEEVSGSQGADLKQRMRTGTVVTTDDRNWELRYTSSARRMSLSRAVGVDMESATIAGQGYRFRVPYGTLLCVSDKPLHGEIKLPGQANKFYEEAIAAHLRIGVAACRRLRDEGERLHSRKLRAFNEPPFR
jgi:AMP nucleosidase